MVAAAKVAVATPEMIYPAQARNVLVSTPPTELPRTAYPLLVNAFETIDRELIGF